MQVQELYSNAYGAPISGYSKRRGLFAYLASLPPGDFELRGCRPAAGGGRRRGVPRLDAASSDGLRFSNHRAVAPRATDTAAAAPKTASDGGGAEDERGEDEDEDQAAGRGRPPRPGDQIFVFAVPPPPTPPTPPPAPAPAPLSIEALLALPLETPFPVVDSGGADAAVSASSDGGGGGGGETADTADRAAAANAAPDANVDAVQWVPFERVRGVAHALRKQKGRGVFSKHAQEQRVEASDMCCFYTPTQ